MLARTSKGLRTGHKILGLNGWRFYRYDFMGAAREKKRSLSRLDSGQVVHLTWNREAYRVEIS